MSRLLTTLKNLGRAGLKTIAEQMVVVPYEVRQELDLTGVSIDLLRDVASDAVCRAFVALAFPSEVKGPPGPYLLLEQTARAEANGCASPTELQAAAIKYTLACLNDLGNKYPLRSTAELLDLLKTERGF